MEALHNTVGRFVEDQGRLLMGKRFEDPQPCALFRRQEAAEVKLVGGQAGADQPGKQSGRAWDRFNPDAEVSGTANDAEARVGQQRRSGVGDERDALPGLKPRKDLGSPLRFVVFVVAHRLGGDAVVMQQVARSTCVFARNPVDFLENPHRPVRDVLKIADRRGDNIEATGHMTSIGRQHV